jgi:hypothetical protein
VPQGQQLPVHALGCALVELLKVHLQRIRRVSLRRACPWLTSTCRHGSSSGCEKLTTRYVCALEHESTVSRIQLCRNGLKTLSTHKGIHVLLLNVATLLRQFCHTTSHDSDCSRVCEHYRPPAASTAASTRSQNCKLHLEGRLRLRAAAFSVIASTSRSAR